VASDGRLIPARREPVAISRRSRWAIGAAGVSSYVTGCVAVFTRANEAGPVALIAVGAVLFLLGVVGTLPTRLKWGDSEAQWQLEIAESVEQVDRATDEIGALLDRKGATLGALLAGEATTLADQSDETARQVQALERDIRRLRHTGGDDAVPTDALLELARWHMAQQDWREAARHFDEYIARVDAEWDVYFSLGVANANQRGGASTDRAALRAYDEAMARLPEGTRTPLLPRLYSYRAAIKKRLGRLVEAKADAEVAQQLSISRYEMVDSTYNLACIEAMLGNRSEALRELRALKELGGIRLVTGHLEDYFRSLADDPEFQSLLLP
jgi:tetratricopeptide (TPR) repeat protein